MNADLNEVLKRVGNELAESRVNLAIQSTLAVQLQKQVIELQNQNAMLQAKISELEINSKEVEG
ncbi:hypothetical protein [Enterococcus diestrammenae]|uniref:hypothetical protein n=1 Tax=Enterococcus diestrammenae TaxID=1155073 RepID=UPI0022E4DED3|nr:hypothetical protein [Enterococcus diestrammenae]